MTIEFLKEGPAKFTPDAIDLFKKHYDEIAERTDIIALDPNYDAYDDLYRRNRLEIHTIRDDGVLVGYSLWFLSKHIHYKNSLTAKSDILYIAPDYRKGMLGAKFIRWTTEEIKKRKPQRIMFHVKPFLDYSPILERNGAKEFETIYSIVLE